MPMKTATKRIPNIYELFYDKQGNLLSSPDVISFKAQDNYANVLLINLEDGIEDNDLVLINFTPKNAVINYTTHWFYVRPLKKIREYIIEGENAPRTFSTYLYEVPRIVLNNYVKNATVENEITIVKRYGLNNLGVFNNYSDLTLDKPATQELYDTNGFAYILNEETIHKSGYYQVIEVSNGVYEWTIRENVMNYGLEQKQYEVKTAYTEAGYANVDNVPNVEGTVVEALWRDLTSITEDIIDLKTFYELQFTPQETNTIALTFNKVNNSYFTVEANVKIDENNNDLLETSSDGLYVKHDDTKQDKLIAGDNITIDPNTNVISSKDEHLDDEVIRVEQKVDTHIEDLNNPHEVTAEQVDTYVKTTIDNKDANTLQEAKDYTNSEINNLDERVDTIIAGTVEGVSGAEIVDARQGEVTLGANITKVKSQLAENAKKIFHSEIINHGQKKPLITILDDDGYLRVYTVLKPLAEKYNIPISSCTITSRVGSNRVPEVYNLEQMKEMQSIGMEFLSHGHDNMNFGNQTEEVVDADLKASAEWLLNNGFDNTAFVIPFGSTSPIVEKVARRYFRSAIHNQGGVNYPPLNTYMIKRVSNDEGLEVMKSKVDEAISNNGWLIIMTHIDGAAYDESDLERIDYEIEELIKYALQQGIEFTTISNGLDVYGNVIDIAGNRTVKVGTDGSISGSLGATNFVSASDIDINQDIDKFDNESITITRFNTAAGSSVSLPEDGYGVVQTFNGDSPYTNYNYQIFIALNTQNVYIRKFSNGVWHNWQEFVKNPTNSIMTFENGWSGHGFTRNLKDGSFAISVNVTVENTENMRVGGIIADRIPRNMKLVTAINTTTMQPVNNFYIDNYYGLRVFNFDGLNVGDNIRINDAYTI